MKSSAGSAVSTRRPTPKEAHDRWIAWRRKRVEENFPDVCTCYLTTPFAKQGSCKKCEMCPGCEQHIKNECRQAHEAKCRALKDVL